MSLVVFAPVEYENHAIDVHVGPDTMESKSIVGTKRALLSTGTRGAVPLLASSTSKEVAVSIGY